jgi:ferredoxin--NADP+ reductase
MSNLSPAPLRVAIVGSGPSGFFAIEHLQRKLPGVAIDLFDRLPTPFGLVRGGVAPDHQKIKAVTRVYEKLASQPGFRFFGNVEIGRDLTREELRARYHAVIYAFGAQSDRTLNVPGESLPGSHAATEFVAWYNGHPDFRDRQFDLSQRAVAVIGMGNVAVDVVRILARTPEELARTDIATYALDALAESQVRDIYMIGRRGPVQAAFTNPEVKELGELPGADAVVDPAELELDPVSAEMAAAGDHTIDRNLQTLRGMVETGCSGKARRIHIRFLRSPIRLEGQDRVQRIVLARNRLVPAGSHDVKAEATDATETIEAGLVFRSVGYLGTGIPGLAVDPKRGVIPNAEGRILAGQDTTSTGEYAVGWIKRGPSGVIGTNKPDAVETVDHLLADHAAGILRVSGELSPVEALLEQRKIRIVTWDDWRILDEIERGKGASLGRPRVKFTTIAEMLSALDGVSTSTPA